MVCSECREKTAAAKKCHVCRRTLAGGYKRCYGAEHIVESIRVPCPNKANGCSAKLARHDQSAHLQACQYRSFHCSAEGCTFVAGELPALRKHFVDAHRWPSTTVYDGTANLVLVDGFNVIKPFPSVSLGHLVLLKVTPESYGRVVTAIHLRAPIARRCQLKLTYETPCGARRLEYEFNLASGELPSRDDSFQFVVPKSVQPPDMDTIKVAFTCCYLESSTPTPVQK
jgi:E3 ubiquitin-protein ligase SIAH1